MTEEAAEPTKDETEKEEAVMSKPFYDAVRRIFGADIPERGEYIGRDYFLVRDGLIYGHIDAYGRVTFSQGRKGLRGQAFSARVESEVEKTSTQPMPEPDTEEAIKILINSAIEEVERTREASRHDVEEIERLKQETRALLMRLMAA